MNHTFIKSWVLTLAALSLVAEAKAVLSLIRVIKSRGKLSRAVWNMWPTPLSSLGYLP